MFLDSKDEAITVLSGSESVLCLYVRRELRTLTATDRAAFFDACEVVFRVPTAEGQLLYGPKYMGLGNFAMDHNTLVRSCGVKEKEKKEIHVTNTHKLKMKVG